MISPQDLTDFIRKALPDARVDVLDTTGTNDHYSVSVVSEGFRGINPLDRHRMVYKALGEPLADGRLHAIEIKTSTAS